MLKKVRMLYLFDFYGKLLTDKQQTVLAYYLNNDLSFTEISELMTISRQAVYDNVKRSEKLLEHYEEELSLFSKFKRAQDAIDGWIAKMDDLADRVEALSPANLRDELASLKAEAVQLIETKSETL
jgi:predicted DNA-binding protein YlxM (UPF0122 family)